jgi:hypothetical protein
MEKYTLHRGFLAQSGNKMEFLPENASEPMQSTRSPKRDVLSSLDDATLNKEQKDKELSTPVKALRNLLPSVPSGWYGNESSADKDKDKVAGKEKDPSPSTSSMSVLDRIKALNNTSSEKTKAIEKEREREREKRVSLSSAMEQAKEHANEQQVTSTAAATATTTEAATIKNEDKSDKSKRRLSMGLTMRGMYDEEMHMPKYSQAEMDLALEKSNAKAKAEGANMDSKTIQELREQLSSLEEALSVANKASLEAAANERVAANELSKLQAAVETDAEDAGLHKIQSKALTHRLQAVEAELSAALAQKEALVMSSAEQCAAAVQIAKAEAEAVVAATKVQSDAALAASVEEGLKRYTALQVEMEEREKEAKSREAKLVFQTTEAVKEAKARVYEKAKLQFEAGNKEFKQVRQQLKDLQQEQETQSAALAAATTSATDLQAQLVLETAKSSAMESHAMDLLELLLGPSAVKRGMDMALAIATARSQLALKEAATISMETEVASLKDQAAKVPSLESKLVSLQAERGEAVAKVAVTHESLKATEVLLGESRAETIAACSERDAQMMAVAKLVTSKAAVDVALENSQSEVKELNERCSNLRKMNEEVMTMLENMHAGK